MTCKQTLALIDSLPLAELPARQREAVEQHAADCPDCRAALEAATSLDAGLARLPKPPVPPGLAASIAARIERLDQRTALRHAESPAAARTARQARPPWTAAIAASLAALAALLLGWAAFSERLNPVPVHIGAWNIGGWTALESQQAGLTALLIAIGLMLYLGLLWSPLRGVTEPQDHPER